ncbi:889_t:CDS:2 [Cetraspora pellucida]|uniref:889_t:CDS:1 n=1 Tax=Cetraspora pellucida TaxID=1433469 RepID=A0A9N9GFC4_9GLOM|nr:889_t:CDS:2 [Cetraspora pellucida]
MSDSEPAAKRLSLGSKRSLSSIIASVSPTPLGKKNASRKISKNNFKSPLNLVQKDPGIKAMIEKQQQLEKDIENTKDNIRKIKLLLAYQEKQTSFLEDAGFSNSWNANWGWEEGDEQQRRCNSDQDDENYCEQPDDVEQKDTMKYMLKKMGIDLDLIKWNEDDECFED